MKQLNYKKLNLSRRQYGLLDSFLFFKNKKNILTQSILSIITILTLIGGMYFNSGQVIGASFTFLQTDWSGGATSNTANHTANQTGWNQYSAKDTGLTVNTDVKFTDTATSLTKTTDVDFNSGTFSNAVTSGSGVGASVILANLALDQIEVVTATLPQGKFSLGCAENSGTHKIYCFGGTDNTTLYNQIIEYDPATNARATKSATLPQAEYGVSCAEDSGTHKIYCFGGYDGTTYYNQIIEYDPSTDARTTKSAVLPVGSTQMGCAENSGTHKIYCFGGMTTGGVNSNQIIEYDPATNTRTTKSATLPQAENQVGCAEDSGTHKIYCFGGSSGATRYNQIIEYNPATNVRTTKSAVLPQAESRLGCAEKSDTHKIYCFGGYLLTNQIIEYDPATNVRTTKLATLPQSKASVGCAEDSGSHQIYCFGGNMGLTYSD
jgi:proteasome assembly chaperone (PAC2) family protein